MLQGPIYLFFGRALNSQMRSGSVESSILKFNFKSINSVMFKTYSKRSKVFWTWKLKFIRSEIVHTGYFINILHMLVLIFSNSNIWIVTTDSKWLIWVILNVVFDILKGLFILHNPAMCMNGYLYNSFTLNGRIGFFVFKKLFWSLF